METEYNEFEVEDMKIADTLASLRKDCKLTQPQVSEFLESHGLSASVKVISKWERGGSLPVAQSFVLLCHKKYNPIRITPSDELRIVGEVVS